MSGQAQVSRSVVWAIGLGIFLVSFLVLFGLGDFGFIAGFFLALLIALLATIVIYLCFGLVDPIKSWGHETAAPSGQAGMSAPQPAPEPEPVTPPKPEPAPEPAAKPIPKPTSEPKSASASEAVSEPKPASAQVAATRDGTRPAGLDGPREGAADDLKMIKGIGPKLERLCNSMGFWHFDQVAAWSADEVAWVDANMKGFRGRVSRDNWVEQAKILAGGGQTEFSKRVEDGDVD